MNTDALAENLSAAILPILKRGNVVEIKRVGDQIQIIEIERKIKHRMTVTTG